MGIFNSRISQGVPVFWREVLIRRTPSFAFSIWVGVRLQISRYANPVKTENKSISQVRSGQGKMVSFLDAFSLRV
ncbi:MAG: hypothetical protein LBT43_04940 [Prevotella sp.]|nr:hypothetical protein [Prevotella sp.]MDR2005455.1 hypothetical protein [Prevotella sp.]